MSTKITVYRSLLATATVVAGCFMIAGAFYPSYLYTTEGGRTVATVSPLQSCAPKATSGWKITTEQSAKQNWDNWQGLNCVSNSNIDKGLDNSFFEKVVSWFEKKAETSVNRPAHGVEKGAVALLVLAGLFVSVIGLLSFFPSLAIYSFQGLVLPIIVQLVGIALAAYAADRRYRFQYSKSIDTRALGRGLGLEIAGIVVAILSSLMWSVAMFRKPATTKYI